jgi:hypothetical protein
MEDNLRKKERQPQKIGMEDNLKEKWKNQPNWL